MYIFVYTLKFEVFILVQLCYLHFLTQLSWSISLCFEDLINLLVKQKIWVIIEELNEYLLSMKFDSYYDDNLLQPEVGAHPPVLPCSNSLHGPISCSVCRVMADAMAFERWLRNEQRRSRQPLVAEDYHHNRNQTSYLVSTCLILLLLGKSASCNGKRMAKIWHFAQICLGNRHIF